MLEGCSNDSCDAEGVVTLPEQSCIIFVDGGRLGLVRDHIEAEIRVGYARSSERISVEGTRFVVYEEPSRVIPEIGIGGFNPDTSNVEISIGASFPGLVESLQTNLASIVSHELHHVARRRTIGYGTSLTQAAISEGLADHFSLEAVGGSEPPIWSLALEGEELATWVELLVDHQPQVPYDHGRWFVGTAAAEVPRWTGYAVGFELVGRFLNEDPSRTPSGLVAEPAQSFVQDL